MGGNTWKLDFDGLAGKRLTGVKSMRNKWKKKSLFLITLIMPVIFAKLWGNKIMIFENLDLEEADSWLINRLMYFQPQSHSVFGEWHGSRMGFPRAPALHRMWVQGSAASPGDCHRQDKAVLLQAQALPAHCHNFKYLSSAANHGRKKNPDYKLHCSPEQQAAFCQEKNNSISFGSRWKFAHKYL